MDILHIILVLIDYGMKAPSIWQSQQDLENAQGALATAYCVITFSYEMCYTEIEMCP